MWDVGDWGSKIVGGGRLGSKIVGGGRLRDVGGGRFTHWHPCVTAVPSPPPPPRGPWLRHLADPGTHGHLIKSETEYLLEEQYGTPGWTLIVRVFIVVRNKKIVSKIFYFMVEKFEIKARFLIQGWEFHFALPERILIVRVFIVVRNKKIVSKIFYFMVEKFEIKARFLIQGWEFHFALPERILIVRVFIVVRNKKNRVQNILFYGWKIWNQCEILIQG